MPAESPEVMGLTARVAGQSPERFGVIARLLVSPRTRRIGVAGSLLHTATGHAVALGLAPMLEVTTDLQPAIDVYEACAWLRIGQVAVRWQSTGDLLDEYAYLAPSALA